MNIRITKDSLELTGEEFNKEKNDLKDHISLIYKMIEEEIGPVDKAYIVSEINFCNEERRTTIDDNTKSIQIYLPISVMLKSDDCWQRKLNLSHELIHSITPLSKYSDVTNLEEGLATEFSERYAGGCNSNPPANYLMSRDCVRELFRIDSSIIQKLRVKYPHKKMRDYTCDDFASEIGNEHLELIEKLVKPFYGNP